MRSADEPENRRATPVDGTVPAKTAMAADPAADASGAVQDLPSAPAGKPRKPKTTASKPKRPAGKPKLSGITPKPAQGTGTAARAAVTPVMVAVPSARVPGQTEQASSSAANAQPSPAEAVFAAANAAFMAGRDVQVQRELQFEDVPAPKRLAPYATAIAATVQRDDADVAWGRLVLLYDPDGQRGWDGFFRLVAYIRADVEPEIAADPLLGEVGWSWLSEALDAHVPGYAVPSGTVTRVITEGFGAKRDEVPLTGFELRASWSPAGPEGLSGATGPGPSKSDLVTLDLSAHIAAWCDCLSAAAGLEPPGTRALRQPGCG